MIVGAAPDDSIVSYIATHGTGPEGVWLLVRENRLESLKESYNIHYFKGRIHPRRVDLMLRIRMIRPDRIVIVCGRSFSHDNVRDMLSAAYCFGKEPEIIWYCHDSFLTFHGIMEQRRRHIKKRVSRGISFGSALCVSFILLFTEAARVSPLVSMGLCLLLVELCLRLGSWPREIYRHPYEVVNGILSRYVADDSVGYKLKPGRYVTLYKHENWPDKQVGYTVGEDGFRITSEKNGCEETKSLVAVFGDSWTYGKCLDDSMTFCWKLQAALPGHTVKNCSCPGHSLYQQFLVLQNICGIRKPAVAVIGFEGQQDFRVPNILREIKTTSQTIGLKLKNYKGKPGAVEDSGQLTRLNKEKYSTFFSTENSAVISCLEWLWNSLKYSGRDKKVVQSVKLLFEEIKSFCKNNAITLIVADLQLSKNPYVDYLQRHGFNVCTSYPYDKTLKLTNEPYDNHANDAVNTLYARMIAAEILALNT